MWRAQRIPRSGAWVKNEYCVQSAPCIARQYAVECRAAPHSGSGTQYAVVCRAIKRDFYRIFVGCTLSLRVNKEPAAIEKGLHEASRVKIGESCIQNSRFWTFNDIGNINWHGNTGWSTQMLEIKIKGLLIYANTDHLPANCTRIYIGFQCVLGRQYERVKRPWHGS